MAAELPRDGLLARILARPEPIVLIEAPAGCGKSVLLRQLAARLGREVHLGTAPPAPPGDGAPLLWDLPPHAAPGPLPERFMAGADRLILAKRPQAVLPGLDRAVAYGRAHVIDTAALLFTAPELAARLPRRRAERIMDASGGWPLLLGFVETGRDAARLEAVLAEDWMAALPAADFVTLGRIIEGEPLSLADAGPLAPAIRAGTPSALRAEALRPHLARGHAADFARRIADAETAAALAAALRAQGRTLAAIAALQAAGHHDAARAILSEQDGFFYFYRCGGEAFARILAGFPPAYAERHETLVLARCLQALKRGDLPRTRQLVADHFGNRALAADSVFDTDGRYSREFRFFRVLMLIYEDVLVSDDLFERIFGLIRELPADAHLQRGSFYNSMLEFFIRRRRFAEAEDVAIRAWEHYAAADMPMLQFYIRLHQSVMRLLQGDAQQARRFADAAAADLAAVGYASPNDSRLLALLQACVDYEAGRVQPLARFLSTEFDDFSHAEIWPTVIDLALHYGSQALSEHFSTLAARSYLDRWRVYQIHTHQFAAMINIREAIILQSGNRWQEAAEKLRVLAGAADHEAVLAQGDLGRLHARDEVALALACLRQSAFEAPARPLLAERLEQIHANLQLTGRQKIAVQLWLAYVSRYRRDPSRCRALLLSALEQAARLGAVAPLAEERYFLAELLGNRRLRDFVQASSPARAILRRLRLAGLAAAPPGVKNGLTRRESKVLLMIAEGGSNKFIAKALGVTEATVKYHLGNAYRKLGCRRRREAINAARALGVLS